jgi:aminopeptidase N
VSWRLAEERAERISRLAYDLEFQIPAEREEAIAGRVAIEFLLSDAEDPLALDFEAPVENVLDLTINDVSARPLLENGHLVLPAERLVEGQNQVVVEFTAGDGPLNRNEEFLYTLFVPDRARRAFPVFDQPDLKARYRLTLTLPDGWTAVANGRVLEKVDEESPAGRAGRTRLRYAETAPLSTYLFSFAAGRFEVVEAERAGRRMRLFHRESDSARVAHNLEAIFDLHGAALEWLETYTGIPYPFEKFDFVAIPSFQYNGMEHPGAILYRASSLFLEESATVNQALGRASVIAHETAHMWFGDLVTMRWFNDVWLKEVFANFMAAKIVNPSFPDVDHDLRFLLAHYPAAYAIDRSEGANPIRQPLDNLAEAGTLYGAIIYQKAPVVMKHLELLVGEEALRDGLREYLRTFRYANASWIDLVEILDRRSPVDLAAWSHVWVEEPGRPTVEVALSGDSIVLEQHDPWQRGRVWPQPLQVLVSGSMGVSRAPVRLEAERAAVRFAGGPDAVQFTLANGSGVGYGYFPLNAASRAHLLRELPNLAGAVPRAVAWLSLWDEMLEGRVDPAELVGLAERLLRVEGDDLIVSRVASDLHTTYWRFLEPGERARMGSRLESLLWSLAESAGTSSLKSVYFRAYTGIAETEGALQRLAAVWRGDRTIPGLTVSEPDFIRLALELAVREVPDAAMILGVQEERIENADRQARFAFVRPALSSDPVVRTSFFDSLRDPENREREPWVIEAVSYLHHPLRADASLPFLQPSLELLEEIQRTGDIFFPMRWLDATLSGYRSPEAADLVRDYLAEHPGLPVRLRGKLLQSASLLFRASRSGPIDEHGGRRDEREGSGPGVRSRPPPHDESTPRLASRSRTPRCGGGGRDCR